MRTKPRYRKKIVASLLLIALAVPALTFVKARTPEESKSDVPSSSRSAQAPSFDKSRYATNKADSIWVVANKSRALEPLNYNPSDLVAVGGGQQLRQEAASALQQLMNAAQAEGLALRPMSGFRSYATQQTVYAREVAANGQAVADTQSAKPGHSEHQTGLAIDVGGGGCGIEDCFGSTPQGKWVAAHAHEYGYIVRYTAGKEASTGYRPEPWHIRYVGKELAAELKRTNQTMEEFFGL